MEKRFNMWISDDLRNELRRLSYETERPISEIVRESINDYLERERKKAASAQIVDKSATE